MLDQGPHRVSPLHPHFNLSQPWQDHVIRLPPQKRAGVHETRNGRVFNRNVNRRTTLRLPQLLCTDTAFAVVELESSQSADRTRLACCSNSVETKSTGMPVLELQSCISGAAICVGLYDLPFLVDLVVQGPEADPRGLSIRVPYLSAYSIHHTSVCSVLESSISSQRIAYCSCCAVSHMALPRFIVCTPANGMAWRH